MSFLSFDIPLGQNTNFCLLPIVFPSFIILIIWLDLIGLNDDTLNNSPPF